MSGSRYLTPVPMSIRRDLQFSLDFAETPPELFPGEVMGGMRCGFLNVLPGLKAGLRFNYTEFKKL